MVRLAVVAIAAALAVTASASADGDPASDFLIQQDVFVPYPPPSAASTNALSQAVDAVDAKGDRVKVAVIASAQDLGSDPSMFGRAADYSKFLAAEIAFVYKGPLLIVMASGSALYDEQTSVELDGPKPSGPGATALTTSAAADVTAFERAGRLHYRDTYRPTTFVAPERATAGKTAQLRYQVWDDSGRAAVVVTVQTAAGRKLAAIHVARRQVRQGTWYAVSWPVPKTLGRATLAVCATAADPAGNKSRTSCGKLTVT